MHGASTRPPLSKKTLDQPLVSFAKIKSFATSFRSILSGGSESSSDDSSELESLCFRLIRKSGQVET